MFQPDTKYFIYITVPGACGPLVHTMSPVRRQSATWYCKPGALNLKEYNLESLDPKPNKNPFHQRRLDNHYLYIMTREKINNKNKIKNKSEGCRYLKS